jgi:hypothetical protein
MALSLSLIKQESAISTTYHTAQPVQKNEEAAQVKQPSQLDKKQLRDAMGKIVAETVQAIARDNFNRMQHYSANPKLLEGGIWYQSNYYDALVKLAEKKPNAQKRLDWCRNNNYFYHFYAPKELFVGIPSQTSPTGINVNSLEINPSTTPAQAIESLLDKKLLALIDCLMTAQLGQCKALHYALGTERFNKLLNHNSGSPLRIGGLSDTLDLFYVPTSGAPAVGQCTGAVNLPEYNIKHLLMGECSKINLVVSDASDPNNIKYVGLGVSPDGATKDEVEQMLVDEQNSPPRDASSLSDGCAKKCIPWGREYPSALRKCAIDPNKANQLALKQVLVKNGTPPEQADVGIKVFVKIAQPITLSEARKNPEFGLLKRVIDFDIDLIQKLIQMPLEQVSLDFVRQFIRIKTMKNTVFV